MPGEADDGVCRRGASEAGEELEDGQAGLEREERRELKAGRRGTNNAERCKDYPTQ
jgi:hypothetical protein